MVMEAKFPMETLNQIELLKMKEDRVREHHQGNNSKQRRMPGDHL
jgi:hypothetical protein